jgi:queuine/archaeosine tRNA-ribosyltransferase
MMLLKSGLCGCRGSQSFEFDIEPSSIGVNVAAHQGVSLVTPSKYMDYVLAMKPDFYVTLVDETYSHPAKRRSENVVARSGKWLEECLARSSAHNDALPSGQAPLVAIGSIAGCAVMQQGGRAAQSVVQHDAKLAGVQCLFVNLI